MKFKKLLKEVSKDKENRDVAESIYDNLIDHLESGGEARIKKSINIENFVLSVDLSDFHPSMMSEYYSLEIKFHSKFRKKTKGNLKWRGTRGSIINLFHVDFEVFFQNKGIPLDVSVAKINSSKFFSMMRTDEFKKDVMEVAANELRMVRDLRETFFEEIHHYLDYVRTEGNVSLGDKDDYWEKNTEINAKFQSAISSFKKDISGDTENIESNYEFQEKWRNDFQSFKDWFFDRKFSKKLVRNLSKSQEKKVINRLYKFWEKEIKR